MITELHAAEVAEEAVCETAEEEQVVARTPSLVAEAMSKSLPDSRATSSANSSGLASPAADDSIAQNYILEDTGTTTDAQQHILNNTVQDDWLRQYSPAPPVAEDEETSKAQNNMLEDAADDEKENVAEDMDDTGGSDEQVSVQNSPAVEEQLSDDMTEADDEAAAAQDEVKEETEENEDLVEDEKQATKQVQYFSATISSYYMSQAQRATL